MASMARGAKRRTWRKRKTITRKPVGGDGAWWRKTDTRRRKEKKIWTKDHRKLIFIDFT